MSRRLLGLLACLITCLTSGCALLAPTGPDTDTGTSGRGRADATAVYPIATRPATQAVSTAHPLASRAALDMLARGGTAIDAAIAAQMVLGLLEPQSSGIGGGSLILHWDGVRSRLSSYEGLAAAPARVTASLRTDSDGSLLDADASQRGGRTVGVPGTLSVLKLAHEQHGKLPWADLFQPAIELAERGYPIAAYVQSVLAQPGGATLHSDWLNSHFDADGRPLAVGTLIHNPTYAATLKRVAELGPAGLFEQGGAAQILAALQRGYRPSFITERDLRAYRAAERDPVCAPFLRYRICAAGPPSFGGIVVLQVLQMLQATGETRFDFSDPAFVHRFAEAGRLAQADRLLWVGDPDFVRVPVQALTAAAYTRERARLIDDRKAHANPPPGEPLPRLASLPPDDAPAADTTSQIAIVDAIGNALSITTTINLNFGARLAVGGFVLNNALTNFSAAPRPGQQFANQMQPGKRPVTSMAPVIVFDEQGQVLALGGSAGGGQIVDYIGQSLIEMLVHDRSPAQALSAGHVSTAVRPRVQLEQATNAAALAPALRARGHQVEIVPMTSGLGFLKRVPGGWLGAADPRRDGLALGR